MYSHHIQTVHNATHEKGGDWQRCGKYGTNRDHPHINWWDSYRIPICKLRAFPHVASEFHVIAARICNKFHSTCPTVLRPLCTLRVVTIFVLQFQARDEFNHRLIRAQISDHSCHLPESSQKYLWQPISWGQDTLLQPHSTFSLILNSHLTWPRAMPHHLRVTQRVPIRNQFYRHAIALPGRRITLPPRPVSSQAKRKTNQGQATFSSNGTSAGPVPVYYSEQGICTTHYCACCKVSLANDDRHAT
jgi:hypothetical protein